MQEEYNVEIPSDGYVYYDTVLDTTMKVYETDDEYVTYIEQSDVENIHSDPMEKFLAWLAAGRFVKVGSETEDGDILSRERDVSQAFKAKYGIDPSVEDPIEMARHILQDQFDQEIQMG